MPGSLGVMPGSLGKILWALGNFPRSLGVMPRALGVMPRTLGNIPGALGKSPGTLGDFPWTLGKLPGGKVYAMASPIRLPGFLVMDRRISRNCERPQNPLSSEAVEWAGLSGMEFGFILDGPIRIW